MTAAPWVSAVALRTGCGVQRLGMTGAAGTTTMIDAASAFIGNARVWAFIGCRPVIRCMTGCAVQAKHPGVEGWVIMTARTGS